MPEERADSAVGSVITRAAPRLGQYAVLLALLLVAAVASQRVEAVVIAVPLLALLIGGAVLARRPRLALTVTSDRDRILEGSSVTLHFTVTADPRPAEVELRLSLPIGVDGGDTLPRVIMPRRQTEEVDLALAASRWGGYRLRGLEAIAHDRLGFYAWRTRSPVDLELRVYPQPDKVRRLLRPLDTQPAAGSNVSRARGEGFEFADITEYQPGDQVRRVNWRASGRRGALMVNRHHPERSSDVVVFVDAYTDYGTTQASSLAASVRIAAALAQAHLRHRDRVGVISWGGLLRWLLPSSGARQAYRILDVLVDTQVQVSYAWRGIAHVPPRTLPAHAQVLAVSALADERPIEALLNLAARGSDLSLIEVSLGEFLPPPLSGSESIARRLYELRRSLLRDRFRAAGVPVATWAPGVRLAALVEELEAFRRSARIRRPA